MQTKPKSNSVITHALGHGADGSAVITFKVAGAGDLTLAVANLSEANRTRAMIHGLVQRVNDAGAKSRNPATGQPASPVDKLASMARLVDHYASGSVEWSPVSAGGATGGLDQIILAAVVEATGKTTAEVRAMIEAGAGKAGVTQKVYLASLGTAKIVAPIVARIRGEQVTLDGDDLLAQAMGEESDSDEEAAE